MPVQPKKINRKSSSKKPPVKKKRRSKKSKNSNFKQSILIVLGVFAMISMVVFGYFLGQNTNVKVKTPLVKKYKKHEEKSQKKLLKDQSKIAVKEPQHIKPLNKPLAPKIIEVDEVLAKPTKKVSKVHLKSFVGKPKLLIIIDDVSNRKQLKRIQALHLKITPSIFPPSERSMKSHHLAKGLKHYMIHLPMESGSKQFNTQFKTLKTSFSNAKIIARAKELRRLFPTAQYVNNHTGSVFTNDYRAMYTLYVALRKEGFMFVDSRTIASTKVPKIVKKLGDTYVARDIFIDNVHNVNTIHKQLRKAVALAKKKGYAIAIGHPHTITMKALSQAKHILEDVELIYIDNLMTI